MAELGNREQLFKQSLKKSLKTGEDLFDKYTKGDKAVSDQAKHDAKDNIKKIYTKMETFVKNNYSKIDWSDANSIEEFCNGLEELYANPSAARTLVKEKGKISSDPTTKWKNFIKEIAEHLRTTRVDIIKGLNEIREAEEEARQQAKEEKRKQEEAKLQAELEEEQRIEAELLRTAEEERKEQEKKQGKVDPDEFLPNIEKIGEEKKLSKDLINDLENIKVAFDLNDRDGFAEYMKKTIDEVEKMKQELLETLNEKIEDLEIELDNVKRQGLDEEYAKNAYANQVEELEIKLRELETSLATTTEKTDKQNLTENIEVSIPKIKNVIIEKIKTLEAEKEKLKETLSNLNEMLEETRAEYGGDIDENAIVAMIKQKAKEFAGGDVFKEAELEKEIAKTISADREYLKKIKEKISEKTEELQKTINNTNQKIGQLTGTLKQLNEKNEILAEQNAQQFPNLEDLFSKIEEKINKFGQKEPIEKTVVKEKTAVDYITELPFNIEFTEEQLKNIEAIEKAIGSLKGLGINNLERKLPFNVNDLKKDSYDQLVEHLESGDFLPYLQQIVVIIGALREGNSFKSREFKTIHKIMNLKEVEEVNTTSIKIEKLREILIEADILGDILPNLKIINRKFHPKSRYPRNELTELGKVAANVWTEKMLKNGLINKDLLVTIWNNVYDQKTPDIYKEK